MAIVPFHRPRRRFRSYNRRPEFSSSYRPKRRGTSDLAAIRLVALVSILIGLCLAEWLGAANLPGVDRPSTAGGGRFTICSLGDRAQCVVDGDTIHYAGLKIRLEDIDAPEIFDYKCGSELALGRRATERLLELINVGPFEVVNRNGRDEDRYGRKLRTIERGGRSLGDVLVAEGLARRRDGRRRSWCG
jgi:nuclease-like protein